MNLSLSSEWRRNHLVASFPSGKRNTDDAVVPVESAGQPAHIADRMVALDASIHEVAGSKAKETTT
ncbi:MAG TPA: hypothetical protein ENH56_16110 [Roseobacter sp.]|nr:hypothetical protein [Roseobacter sp.]